MTISFLSSHSYAFFPLSLPVPRPTMNAFLLSLFIYSPVLSYYVSHPTNISPTSLHFTHTSFLTPILCTFTRTRIILCVCSIACEVERETKKKHNSILLLFFQVLFVWRVCVCACVFFFGCLFCIPEPIAIDNFPLTDVQYGKCRVLP